jgi:hypothetical protein
MILGAERWNLLSGSTDADTRVLAGDDAAELVVPVVVRERPDEFQLIIVEPDFIRELWDFSSIVADEFAEERW